MIRVLLLAAASALVASPALARTKAKKEDAAPASLQASPIGTYGDWNVFAAGEGRNRLCYAISQPETRLPKSLKRDPAYLFVTVRKGDKVANEVAVMLGFAPKPGSAQAAAATTAAATGAAPAAPAQSAANDPVMTLGSARYALVVKGTNAWLQNPAEEGRVVAEMGKVKKLTVKAASLRGNVSTDEYSLDGFGEAMKRTREECK
ncbi:hypothetical protein [Methylobacterium oryzihabitans]|uniref:Invasion associated locus b family protein n=1 Tax=Methylobacterium oryzihabitans TaxID=2499852 RepID=A0A437P033_9HYPH|nr:hypothetical protein [Methylobacterium oryzihabitans]RVU15651.1 hypothetical protein EOE48_19270 [Methylobacterium oryzihabitans]